MQVAGLGVVAEGALGPLKEIGMPQLGMSISVANEFTTVEAIFGSRQGDKASLRGHRQSQLNPTGLGKASANTDTSNGDVVGMRSGGELLQEDPPKPAGGGYIKATYDRIMGDRELTISIDPEATTTPFHRRDPRTPHTPHHLSTV